MAAFNYQWSSEGMIQPSVAEIVDQWTTQFVELERKVDALGNQTIQNAYNQQQCNYTPNYCHPGWHDHPSYSWNYNQDQFYAPSYYPQEVFAPELSYPSEFSYQHQTYDVSYQQSQQQDKINQLEEMLSKLMNHVDMTAKTREASLRNLEIQMEQLVNAFNNQPQGTLPSYSEIDPKSEGEEYCEVAINSGKELQEGEGGTLKRSYSDVEEDCGVENKRSKIWEEDEDDQALDLNGDKHISMVIPVAVMKQYQNYEEYYRIDFVVGDDNSDEFKFGGGSQVCKNAMEIKEKTKRRHEKIIFAIEPD